MQSNHNYKIHFETLGCKLNQIESEAAARTFSDKGFQIDLEPLTANSPIQENTLICVVNTCTVTTKAEQKARRIIRMLTKLCPQAAVVVTGCYAELDAAIISSIDNRIAVLKGSRKDILASIPDFISNIQDLDSISAEEKAFRLRAYFEKEMQAKNQDNKLASQFKLYTDTFQTHSRASIKIEDGCNNACAYCRIHLARGLAVSLDVNTVLERVQQLEKAGQHEVVFTGVNLSQYKGNYNDGSAVPRKENFAGLLKILLENTSNINFRISSFYPEHITEELCVYLESPRVRPSFHLSIQSGSDNILRSMRRAYKAKDVYNAAKLLRQAKENPFIACDIIAGFPGESEEDFAQTQQMCNDIKFAWIHAFPFSPRPGTPAYTMTPKVPERIKDERVAWLTENARNNKIEYINSLKGKAATAIIENSRADRMLLKPRQILHAVTDNFLHAEIELQNTGRIIKPGDEVNIQFVAPLVESIMHNKEADVKAVLI
ncbi:MAG: tRNA (N(6)-L-threonylcarbamoyladenosine(37)-C(2))-methylthiotransferase MtaB [Treponema sp.]|nr:tRNA (N(6)-L-threonylcarbamoyladenosine(37)-C(2))-methylthiotransferase MtaB [Treponema sp.]